ncbi:ANTAR domain-containing protein [Kineococcus sp. SYSU DK005]|uniref:ANTAR domain-containing protein n=1 Tax=Kineococcus sp. SYSU DK005 TaxID=3383126 RepID=UPI003D7ED74D
MTSDGLEHESVIGQPVVGQPVVGQPAVDQPAVDQPAVDQPMEEELVDVFLCMSGLLLSEQTVGSALELVTSLAHSTLPSTSAAAVTLVDERGRRTSVAATDPLAEQADSLQYELQEGPCLTALAHERVVRVHDVAREQRWPRWSQAVLPLPVRASLTVPVVIAGTCMGAIKVYGRHPGSYGAHAERVLTLFAQQAGVLIANMQSLEDARRMSQELQQALISRDTISTAKGIVMAREGVDEESAFARLVRTSQRSGKKLHVVAASIVQAVPRRGR